MNPKMTHLKRATALSVIVTLVLCQSYVTGTPLSQVVTKLRNYVTGANSTAPHVNVPKLPATAQLSVQGGVTLNGLNARNGATVFSGGGVKTTETSTALLSLGTQAQVELASASDFTLALEGTTLGGKLRAGRANIVAPAGIAVKIVTADSVVVADGHEATKIAVDVTTGKTTVKAEGTANASSSPTPIPTGSPSGPSLGQTMTLAGITGVVSAVVGTVITLAVTEDSKCYSVNQDGTLSTVVACPSATPLGSPSFRP